MNLKIRSLKVRNLRRWLGNPTADQQLQSVRCWDDNASIFVVVTDNCPCIQTDVNTGAVSGVNPPCCGDIYHMCGALLPMLAILCTPQRVLTLSLAGEQSWARIQQLKHAALLACPGATAHILTTFSAMQQTPGPSYIPLSDFDIKVAP